MPFIPKSEFLRIVEERGFLHQCTDMEGLDALLTRREKSKTPVAAYCGFDCTAPSLHVGSLIQIMLLRWFQKCGHKPIVLLGGGTTKIGDPSGRDESRPALSDESIAENTAGIRGVFDQFGMRGAAFVNNDDWLSALSFMDLMRLGRHLSVNRMMKMDSVKLRLEREQHLSLTEFLYMLMQAYDFVELNKTHDCRLQFGGSDQWGNIVGGVDLHSKMRDGRRNEELFGLTTPLLTTADGAKMGKTAEGAVWLDETMLSPYDYWQFWRNTADADVGRFLKLFTTLPLEKIADMEKKQGAELNEAKKILATEATALCHGKAQAEKAAVTAEQTFEQGGLGAAIPEMTIAHAKLEAGVPVFELFRLAGLAASNGEAKRLIRGGGAKIGDKTIDDENRTIDAAALGDAGFFKLSAGKKRHARIRIAHD